jgi:translation initiation factor 1A
MPKNQKGGKHKHFKKGDDNVKRDLIIKVEGEEYGIVTKMLGDCRLLAKSLRDGVERMCHICGAMQKKKIWIYPNDLVLISLREGEINAGDVILKYTPDEHKELVRIGEITKDLIKIDVTGLGLDEKDANDNVVDFI